MIFEKLRILVIVDPRVITAPILPENFDSWATVYSYHIIKELKRLGHEVEMENVYEIIKGQRPRLNNILFDHALIILNNASRDYGINLFENLKILLNKGGLIGTMSDHDHGIEYEDIRFCATIIDLQKMDSRAHQIYWGCNPEVLIPKKNEKSLNIFLDSWIFEEKKYDRTPELLEACLNYARANDIYLNGKEKIKILAWGETGVEEFTDTSNNKLVRRPIRINFKEMMSYLREADIFIVTHSESMGLTILEAAMAGCLVLIPVPGKPNPSVSRWIKTDLAGTIPHLEIPHWAEEEIKIPWIEIEGKLLPNEIRSQTKKYTWLEVTNKILEGFLERIDNTNKIFLNTEINEVSESVVGMNVDLELRERMLVSVDMFAWPKKKDISERFYKTWNIAY